jgi:outer membrane protein OmpA-like peptidoglycan-associated protein
MNRKASIAGLALLCLSSAAHAGSVDQLLGKLQPPGQVVARDSVCEIMPVCYFIRSRSEVASTCDKEINYLAVTMVNDPGILLVEIGGHSAINDGKDSKARVALSKKRALAVRDALVAKGVEAVRFTMVAYGDAQSKSYKHNARVWFTILDRR